MNGQPRPWEGEKLGKYEAILLKKDGINNKKNQNHTPTTTSTPRRKNMNKNKDKDQQKKLEEDQQEGRKEDKKEDQKAELTWPEDKEILQQHLTNVGFRQTRTDKLYVLSLGDDGAIFIDFRKNNRGKAYPSSDATTDIDEVSEYIAFRKLQKGQAQYNPDKPYQITLKQDNKEIPIRLPYKKAKKERGEGETGGGDRGGGRRGRQRTGNKMEIKYDDETVDIPAEKVADLHGKDFPETDGILAAVNEKKWLKRVNVVMLSYPEKILSDNASLDDYEDIEDMETYGAKAKAVIEREDGAVFTDNGTAHPHNLKRSFYPNVCEMAATRALGRALRRAFGISTVAEEMPEGGEENEE